MASPAFRRRPRRWPPPNWCTTRPPRPRLPGRVGHGLIRRGGAFGHGLVRREHTLGHGLVRRGRALGHSLGRRGRALDHGLGRRGRNLRHESPGISVFSAKHEVLQLMMNSVQGGTRQPARFFLVSRKILEQMLPIYLFDWEFNWITEIRLDDWKFGWMTGNSTE